MFLQIERGRRRDEGVGFRGEDNDLRDLDVDPLQLSCCDMMGRSGGKLPPLSENCLPWTEAGEESTKGSVRRQVEAERRESTHVIFILVLCSSILVSRLVRR